MDPQLWQQPHARAALAARDVAGVFRVLQAAGVSQRRLAAMTGQRQSEISEILGGRKVTSIAVLERIADGVGVSREAFGLVALVAPRTPSLPRSRRHNLARMRAVIPKQRPAPVRENPLAVSRWTAPQIRALREAMRMSVRQFAAHLGVSDRMVSKWEVGARPRPDNQAILDTCLAMAGVAVQERYAAWATRARRGDAPFPTGPRWVVHLPVAVPNLAAALTLAEEITASLADLTHVDHGSVEVSAEDDQRQRRQVFCNRLLNGGARCAGRHGHGGGCDAPAKAG